MSIQHKGLEVLQWDIANDQLPDAVLEELEEYNQVDPDKMINRARGQAHLGGRGGVTWIEEDTELELALLTGEGYSETEAVVALSPFGNRVTNARLVGAHFVNKSLVRAGIRDEVGDKLPTLVVGSPSGRSGLDIDPIARRSMKQGDFSPMSDAVLYAAREQGFSKLRVMGHSMGGVIALDMPYSSQWANVEITAVAAGDAVCSKDYTVPAMIQGLMNMFDDFGSDSARLREEVRAAGLDAYTRAQSMERPVGALRRNLQDIVTGYGALQHPYINWALARGMARATYEQLLSNALAYPPTNTITVGHGTKDQMLAPFNQVHETTQMLVDSNPTTHVRLVEVVGGHHTWGDNIPAVAAFAIGAFSSAIG